MSKRLSARQISRRADIASLEAAHYRFTKPLNQYSDATLHRRANQFRRGTRPMQQIERGKRRKRRAVTFAPERVARWHTREYVTYKQLLTFVAAHHNDQRYVGIIRTLQKDVYNKSEGWTTNSGGLAQFGSILASYPTVGSLKYITGPILLFSLRYFIMA